MENLLPHYFEATFAAGKSNVIFKFLIEDVVGKWNL